MHFLGLEENMEQSLSFDWQQLIFSTDVSPGRMGGGQREGRK